ncbi:SRPBCC family protein [Acidicapsa acidisoli]|uniref:SRPBCC family protein n=1 Tax=Acidicapsa acidisoli TaxID=1615681 RepID=UPI0021DF5212|nr:SRPBCC domain-containing protein [Acidicapsa acidisoli]
MSTQPQIEEEVMQRFAGNAQRRAAGQLDIAMQATIKGDARRIFTALTVPEYREAWMCPPDPNPGSFVTAQQAADQYQLDFYRSGALHATVTGQYQVCRRHRLDFTWRDHRMPDWPESHVRVHIDGHFESSRLTLLHCGIFREDHSRWLHRMWLASLDKLASLF